MLHRQRVAYQNDQHVGEVQVEAGSTDARQEHHSTRAIFLAFEFGQRLRFGLFGHASVELQQLDTVDAEDLAECKFEAHFLQATGTRTSVITSELDGNAE